VDVPGLPFMAKSSADGCWLFVSVGSLHGIGGGGVVVLHNDGGAFHQTQLAPVKDYPSGLALSHDGQTLAVATFGGVEVFDVARLEAGDVGARVATLPFGSGGVSVAISRDDRLIFVSERQKLSIFDFSKARSGELAKLGVIPLGTTPVGLAISADGARLYATSETTKAFVRDCQPEKGDHGQHPEGVLTVIDVATAAVNPDKAVLGVRKAGCNPVRVELSPDNMTAWVTARGDHRLEGFTTAGLTGASAAAPEVSVKVGRSPIGLAVRPDGTQVWVANSNRYNGGQPGSLTAVSPDGRVLRTVSTGVFPRDIHFLPDGKTLMVAQYDSHAVQFVPTDTP
jgi:DNA-binding beta-propeller fold protein YncE